VQADNRNGRRTGLYLSAGSLELGGKVRGGYGNNGESTAAETYRDYIGREAHGWRRRREQGRKIPSTQEREKVQILPERKGNIDAIT